jgi:hypothetical protein
LFLFSLLSASREAFAANYYVSWRAGNDTNSGLSGDTPWKSMARVNHAAFMPGDRVLFHTGETWREQLRPPSSGTEGQPIVFSSYGGGPRPILEGDRRSDFGRRKAASKVPVGKTRGRDVAIDNNDQSHILYDGLSLRHVLEGLRIYAWSATVQDITLRNCLIQVEAAAPASVPSAAVYVNVRIGRIARLHILGNHLIPYPRRLEHWGIYFVAGVQHFQINGNTLGPAGEDGITVWHSAFGEISHNHGGGNGENTIDVKDSHDIVIRDNEADLDREYNIVVHSVDAPHSTYNVRVQGNHCSRAGQGGELSAGIALLFVQKSGVEDNAVDFAFGSGILIKDSGQHSDNWASRNRLTGNGVGQRLPAIMLLGASRARIQDNQLVPPPGQEK